MEKACILKHTAKNAARLALGRFLISINMAKACCYAATTAIIRALKLAYTTETLFYGTNDQHSFKSGT